MSERSPGEANTHLSAQVDRLVASMTAEEVYHKAQGADSSRFARLGAPQLRAELWVEAAPPRKGTSSLHGGEVNNSVKTPYLWLGRVRYWMAMDGCPGTPGRER